MDLKGFGLSMWNRNSIRIVKHFARLASDYFPEILGKMIAVNAPSLISGIWSLIKGWLDEKTRSKISILSSNYRNSLLEYCDIDQIPRFLGGTSDFELSDDIGPWKEYEVVDSLDPGA